MMNAYEQSLYNLDAQASMLLGNFNEQNVYTIDDKINKELIVCNKLIDSFKGDVISAHANVAGYKLQFSVFIQLGEDNKKRAGLFLEEQAKLGLVSKKLQTYITSVVLENNGNFFDEIKKLFHLYTVDESSGVDMANANLTAIINKLNGMAGIYETMLPLFYELDKEYVIKMLSLIKRSGKYGEMMLIQLGNEIKAKGLNKLNPRYWRELKLLLDKMLLENKGIFDKQTQNGIEELQKLYMQLAKGIKIPEKPAVKAKNKQQQAKKKADDKKKPKKKKKSADQKSISPVIKGKSNSVANNVEHKIKPVFRNSNFNFCSKRELSFSMFYSASGFNQQKKSGQSRSNGDGGRSL